jgi:hypothetical protein
MILRLSGALFKCRSEESNDITRTIEFFTTPKTFSSTALEKHATFAKKTTKKQKHAFVDYFTNIVIRGKILSGFLRFRHLRSRTWDKDGPEVIR